MFSFLKLEFIIVQSSASSTFAAEHLHKHKR